MQHTADTTGALRSTAYGGMVANKGERAGAQASGGGAGEAPADGDVPRAGAGTRTDGRPVDGWFAACLVVGALLWLAIGAYVVVWGRHWDLDLHVYWDGGRTVLHHQPPYRMAFTVSRLSFTYPPFALLVFSVVALVPWSLAQTAWWLLNCGALALVIYLCLAALPMGRRRAGALAFCATPIAVLAFEPLRSNMDYGQIDVLLLLAIVADLLARPSARRGIWIGLAGAIKLTPLVYLSYFALVKDRAALIRGVATCLLATGLAWLVIPAASHDYWFGDVSDTDRIGPIGFASNQSWNGLLHRYPFHGGGWATIAWPVLATVTLAVGLRLTYLLTKTAHRLDPIVALSATAVLVSPISWTHHWSWIVVVPVALLGRWGEQRAVDACMCLLMAVAVTAPYWWTLHGWPAAVSTNSLLLSGALLLVVWELVEEPGLRRTRSAAMAPATSTGHSA